MQSPSDSVIEIWNHGNSTLVVGSRYDDITKITKRNEEFYIPNVIDLVIEMILWNSDLGPPQNHDTRLSIPREGSSSVAETQQGPIESITPPPESRSGMKRTADFDSIHATPSRNLGAGKKDILGQSNRLDLHPTLSSTSTTLKASTISFKNTNSSRNVPSKTRYTWFCCQCRSGPKEISYTPQCLECYHFRCSGCIVEERRVSKV